MFRERMGRTSRAGRAASVHATRLGPVGITTLMLGLGAVASAIGLELYEIGLARLTVAGELADIFTEHS